MKRTIFWINTLVLSVMVLAGCRQSIVAAAREETVSTLDKTFSYHLLNSNIITDRICSGRYLGISLKSLNSCWCCGKKEDESVHEIFQTRLNLVPTSFP